MTVTALPAPAATAGACMPHLGEIVRRVALSLTIACLVPATLFYAVLRVSGVWAAIVATLVWSYGTLAWRAASGRRTPGLLVLTTAILTGRTLVALLADSTFVYFLQPILTDCLIGTAFLLSLRTGRPMVARLAGDFYPIDDELARRPRVRRLLRRLTMMWAALALAKAGFTLWLLLSQTVETFVLVKSVAMLSANGAAVAATIAAAMCVGRREGLVRT